MPSNSSSHSIYPRDGRQQRVALGLRDRIPDGLVLERSESAQDETTYDAGTRTWTLRSHAAVSEALADPALATGLASDDANAGRDEAVHAAVRAAARDLFPGARLAAWHASLATSARAAVGRLPAEMPVDLMSAVAAPWSLSLAMEATGALPGDAAHLNALARRIFVDAAMVAAPPSRLATSQAREPALALANALAAGQPARAMDVQSFVAIAQTLPHLLVAAWLALFTNLDQLAVWRAASDKRNAVDELLRFAGPSRAVFRRARRTTRCADANIEAGQFVTLMLADANRDPRAFPAPDSLDLSRHNASRHVALGGGLHPCVGTPIIRQAVDVATSALLDRVDTSLIIEDVRWLDGFAIRAPSSLVVRLRTS